MHARTVAGWPGMIALLLVTSVPIRSHTCRSWAILASRLVGSMASNFQSAGDRWTPKVKTAALKPGNIGTGVMLIAPQ